MHDDFRTEQRELVLDIDLTDYDAYRTCCEYVNRVFKLLYLHICAFFIGGQTFAQSVGAL